MRIVVIDRPTNSVSQRSGCLGGCGRDHYCRSWRKHGSIRNLRRTRDGRSGHLPHSHDHPLAGGVRNHVDDDLHYHLDLGPTLAQLLDRTVPDFWDGQSYAKTITRGENAGREYLVISQNAHVCQRSVRFDKWLYIRTYHDGYYCLIKGI